MSEAYCGKRINICSHSCPLERMCDKMLLRFINVINKDILQQTLFVFFKKGCVSFNFLCFVEFIICNKERVVQRNLYYLYRLGIEMISVQKIIPLIDITYITFILKPLCYDLVK